MITPRTTLRRRCLGTPTMQQFNARKRKLDPVEEQSLVQWILDLAQRGFPLLQIIAVRQLADALLAVRGEDPPQPVSKN